MIDDIIERVVEPLAHLAFVALFGALAGIAVAEGQPFLVFIAVVGVAMALANLIEITEAASAS